MATGDMFNFVQLIELVKERIPLYDHSHPAHNNRDITSFMWAQIAKEMGVPEAVCKTKWANLRSNFVRELRRLRPMSDGTIWPPQWPLFRLLTFLIPFLKSRSGNGTVDEPPMITLEDFQEPLKRKPVDSDTESLYKKLRLDAIPAEDDKDDDKLFMLSLVPKMKQLSMMDNLNFRIQVQQLLLNKLCRGGESSVMESVQVELQEHLPSSSYHIKEEHDVEDYVSKDCDKQHCDPSELTIDDNPIIPSFLSVKIESRE